MIVTPGAVHRQAKEDLRSRQQDVVQVVVERLFLADRFIIPDSETVVAGCDDGVGRSRFEFVASQLLLNELRVRLVGVEAVDDVVAVPPRKRLGIIAFVAVAFGVANQVEPMSPPAFSILRRVQQPVDDLFERAVRLVIDEGFDVADRRRQASEVVVRSADQFLFFGRRSRCQIGGFKLLQDEVVDGV